LADRCSTPFLIAVVPKILEQSLYLVATETILCEIGVSHSGINNISHCVIIKIFPIVSFDGRAFTIRVTVILEGKNKQHSILSLKLNLL
jgi:predicted thioesterase